MTFLKANILRGLCGTAVLSFILLCSFKSEPSQGFSIGGDGIGIQLKEEPQFEAPVSQLATEGQFYSPKFQFWCDELREPFNMHRKLWEYCYVLEVLDHLKVLRPGSTALGFGVGKEPLPSLFAKYGIGVVASDQDFKTAHSQGWAASNQHMSDKASLNGRFICDPTQFDQLVTLATVDMNHVPASLHNKFDIVWSCCSLEHLGSIEAGLQFIKNSVKCLKPGGVAVHTTEFNLSSNTNTVHTGGTVLYRRQDIIRLVCDLIEMGYEVMDLNLNRGTGRLDTYIDLPPYHSNEHIKLQIAGYECTSIGIVIRKPL